MSKLLLTVLLSFYAKLDVIVVLYPLWSVVNMFTLDIWLQRENTHTHNIDSTSQSHTIFQRPHLDLTSSQQLTLCYLICVQNLCFEKLNLPFWTVTQGRFPLQIYHHVTTHVWGRVENIPPSFLWRAWGWSPQHKCLSFCSPHCPGAGRDTCIYCSI